MVLLPRERLAADSKPFTQCSRLFSPVTAAALCHLREGRQAWQGSGTRRIRKRQCCSAIDALTCSSGQLSSCFSGYKGQKAKCFLRGRKKEKKLFPSAEPKAALLTQKFLVCYRTKWKGQESQAMPTQWKRKLLQTVSSQYVQSTL